MLKGALHVHSTYSDGEFTLAELKDLFCSCGCDFACITDHAEAFDNEKLQRYRNECASLSGNNFLFVTGLEYGCERGMHVLGYGAQSLLHTRDPQQVIAKIQEREGLAVIAHPKDDALPWIESFEVLPDGIETWNSKYDGRYAPRPQVFRTLRRLQERRCEMRAFYGQDLHWRKQYRGLFNVLECSGLNEQSILNALHAGAYFGTEGKLQLPSSGEIPEALLAQFTVAHARSRRLRKSITNAKKALELLGIPIPSAIKAQLRRIF